MHTRNLLIVYHLFEHHRGQKPLELTTKAKSNLYQIWLLAPYMAKGNHVYFMREWSKSLGCHSQYLGCWFWACYLWLSASANLSGSRQLSWAKKMTDDVLTAAYFQQVTAVFNSFPSHCSLRDIVRKPTLLSFNATGQHVSQTVTMETWLLVLS